MTRTEPVRAGLGSGESVPASGVGRNVRAALRSPVFRVAAVIVVACGVGAQLLALPSTQPWPPYRIDFDVYRTGAQVLLDGGSLYDQIPAVANGSIFLPFTYPPFAAALFSIFTVVPLWAGSILLTAASVAAMVAVLRMVLVRLVDLPSADIWWLVTAAVGVALWLGPVSDTLGYGQINMILMYLVVLDALAGRGRPWRGVPTGIAIAIKLTPAVFVLYFLLRRDLRAAVVSLASALACTALGHVVTHDDSSRYWTTMLFDPARIGDPVIATNQSLRGFLLRVHIPSSIVWIACVAAVTVVALVVAWLLLRADARVAALCVIAFVALYGSPVTWDHHWVWSAPLLAVLVVTGYRSPHPVRWYVLALTGAVAFLTAPQQRLPNRHGVELTWNWGQHLVGSSYLIWGLVVLAVLGVAARGRPSWIADRPWPRNIATGYPGIQPGTPAGASS